MSVQYTGPDTTITTTGNIDDLDFGNATLLRVNNAADATIRGLKAGVDGQIVVVASIGAGNVFLAHQNAGSAAANRLINDVTSGNTPLAAGKGAAIYQYDATTARWRLVNHEQGASIAQAYVSTDYTADVGTWTVDAGDLATYAYTVRGKYLRIDLTVNTSSLSSTPTRLQVLIPNGYTYTREARQTAIVFNNATNTTGMARSVAASTQFFVYRDPNTTAYAVATNTTQVITSFEAEID